MALLSGRAEGRLRGIFLGEVHAAHCARGGDTGEAGGEGWVAGGCQAADADQRVGYKQIQEGPEDVHQG